MPELPEVETVRRVLTDEIIGLKITEVVINYPKMISPSPDIFKTKLANAKFISINRIGKFLIFNLDNNYSFISHLRMEGKYFYCLKDYPINKHMHVIFKLDNNHILIYQDVRKFGVMILKETKDVYNTPPLSNVGAEPFSITKDELSKKLQNKKLPIKTLLLDQSIMSGLGNIYVDEVLFKSKINPNKLGLLITDSEVERIIDSSKEILSLAIHHKGTTIRSYTSSLGVSGEYQNFLQVHTKEICPICNEKLERIKIGGRSTYFCKKCQK